MRVWISGANGFIGTHVEKKLREAGHTTRGFDVQRKMREDVTDPHEVELAFSIFQPDIAVHLAAQVFLGPSLSHPMIDAQTNILGTLNVLEAARKYGVPVVLSSSGAVYGSNDRSNVKESDMAEPMSPYGLSKHTAERYTLLYNDLYDMKNIVFRFSSVYGLGRKKTSINLILDKAMKQLKVDKHNPEFPIITITGDGTQTRDFTYVTDVAEAVLMAVNGKFPAGTYNIGTGKSTSLNLLVQTIAKLLGQMLITEYTVKSQGDPLRNDFNVEKAGACGFKTKVSLEEGLKLLIDEMF